LCCLVHVHARGFSHSFSAFLASQISLPRFSPISPDPVSVFPPTHPLRSYALTPVRSSALPRPRAHPTNHGSPDHTSDTIIPSFPFPFLPSPSIHRRNARASACVRECVRASCVWNWMYRVHVDDLPLYWPPIRPIQYHPSIQHTTHRPYPLGASLFLPLPPPYSSTTNNHSAAAKGALSISDSSSGTYQYYFFCVLSSLQTSPTNPSIHPSI
jgi:hypothetical protein